MITGLFSLGSRILLSNLMELKRPYKVTFAVTYRCNSRCKTCNIWKVKPAHELTTRELTRIIPKLRVAWLNLTGGEPLLRRDLYEIAAAYRKSRHAFMLNFTTNGSLPQRTLAVAKRIKALHFPRCIMAVSINGPEKLHDELAGVRGRWKKAVETYKGLRHLRGSGFQPYVGYTISGPNAGLLGRTLNSLKQAIPGFSIRELHANIYHESSVYYANKGIGLRATKKSIMSDVGFLLANKPARGIIGLIEHRYLKLINQYLNTGKSPLPCQALSASCFIEPTGEVFPCTGFPVKLGNIRDSGLEQIWSRSRNVRQQIRNERCAGCWSPCEAYQTIFGNLMKRLL